MRSYEFSLNLSGQEVTFTAKTLPLVKATALLKNLSRFVLPLMGAFQTSSENQEPHLDHSALMQIFMNLDEKEIFQLYGLLFWGITRSDSLKIDLVKESQGILHLDYAQEIFSGELEAVIDLALIVIKENFGNLGKLMAQNSWLGKSTITI